jgi:outer membrane protein
MTRGAWRVALGCLLGLRLGGAELVPAPAGPWTLEAAVAHARTASPEARMAEARVAAAEAARGLADAMGQPRVNLRARYGQTDEPMQAFGAILNQGTFDNRIDFNRPGQLDAFSAALEARYALYTGGRIEAGRAAARAAGTAAAADRKAALDRLGVAVVRAYFDMSQAAAAIHALESTVAALDESLRLGRLREDAGQLLRSERLNLEVQREQTALRLLAGRQARQLAERQLAFLLGLAPGTAVALASEDRTTERLTLASEPTPAALTDHPEQMAWRSRLEAADRQVAAAGAARRPSVGAVASLQHDRGWRRDGSGDSWSAGVAAEWAVFDGGETRARIRQAEAERETARAGAARQELALHLQLEQALLGHRFAREQVEVARRAVGQAEESARLSRERFAAGSLLSAELIGVETRLVDARLQSSQADAAERVAAAELRRAAGLPLFE